MSEAGISLRSHLVSRASAAALRSKLLPALEAGGPVELDFSGVELIAPGWADEFFGVLAAAVGPVELFERLRLRGLTAGQARVIGEVLRLRLVERGGAEEEPILQALRELGRRRAAA